MLGAPNILVVAYWGLTTSTWLVMWVGLLVMTLLLAFVLRTRWSSRRTWQKCAVLSLWVHVLLAVISCTVCVVTGAPESGPDEPIHVAIVTEETVPEEPVVEESVTEEPAEEELPDWEFPAAPSLVAPQTEPVEVPEPEPADETPAAKSIQELVEASLPEPAPLSASSLEAPDLLASLKEREPATAEVSNEETPPRDQPPADELTESSAKSEEKSVETPSDSQKPDVKREQKSNQPAQAPPTPPKPASRVVPHEYVDRLVQDKLALVRQRGGSEQTERAVQAALGWLAAAQSENGGWDASKFGAGRERIVLGHNRQGAGREADTGVTSLAVLAFLGAGHSHHHGEYRREVARALEYLRQNQRADGSLHGNAELFARTYCHSMATLAICEAYAMTNDDRLEPSARGAVAYSLSLQHPSDGGWRYRRGDTGDTSQLGWQVMALRSAETAGIHIPPVVWTRVERFLKRVERGAHGGLASYRPDSPASRTMTAEAWFCRQQLSQTTSTAMNPAETEEALDYLLQEMPSASMRNLYYWYYATLALQQNQEFSAAAKSAWEDWNHYLTTALIATQQNDGSWDDATLWGGYGGRVYTTAVSTLCLEVYYRYKPETDLPEVADRKGWQSIR